MLVALQCPELQAALREQIKAAVHIIVFDRRTADKVTRRRRQCADLVLLKEFLNLRFQFLRIHFYGGLVLLEPVIGCCLIIHRYFLQSVNYLRLPLYIEAAMRVISSGVSSIPWENQRSRQE